MLQTIYYRFIESPALVRILGIAVFFIVSFGITIHYIEPATFPTVFEGIWWSVVTASTVGFGDYAPKTTAGRLLGIGLIFAGAGFLAAYFINLAAVAVTSQNSLREGRALFQSKNHLIIVGWNERAKEIIKQLQQLPVTRHIVLIDETLNKNPYSEKIVHFIKGAPFKEETLKKANLSEAAIALITSDQNKNEGLADMHSILTLVAMKGWNSGLYCIVEILTKDQSLNARRAGADEIIETNRHASSIMFNSLHYDKMASTVNHLLDPLNGGHLKIIEAEDDWLGNSFQQLSPRLLKRQILLIGIQRGGETFINPPLDTYLQPLDLLLVIKN